MTLRSISRSPPPSDAAAFLKEFEELHRLVSLNSALMGATTRADADTGEIKALTARNNNLKILRATLALKPTRDDLIEEAAKKTNEFVVQYLQSQFKSPPQFSPGQLALDLETISFCPPAVKTTIGVKGPTLLVSYLLKKNPPQKECKVSHVLKWTTNLEVISNSIYDLFATGFTGKRGAFEEEFFFVPRMVAFSPNTRQIDREGALSLIDPATAESFKTIFQQIIRDYRRSPKIAPPEEGNNVVVRLERVKGKNLPDFIRNNYETLPEEIKASLFRRLGKIAYLDLLLGNNDRLFHFELDDLKEGELGTGYELNLDNLMVCESPDGVGFGLFAIDNGLDPDFLENAALYLTTMKEILSSPEFHIIFAEKIRKSLEIDFTEKESSAGTNLCKNELGKYLPQLQEGIKTMDVLAMDSLIPAWHSANKRHLTELDPIVLEIVDDRLNAVVEAQLARNSTTPHKLSSFRESNQTPQNLLWTILQHCSGSQEDQSFFATVILPVSDDNPTVQKILDLFHTIRSEKLFDAHHLRNLKTLIQTTGSDLLSPESPLVGRMAPTPLGIGWASPPNTASKDWESPSPFRQPIDKDCSLFSARSLFTKREEILLSSSQGTPPEEK